VSAEPTTFLYLSCTRPVESGITESRTHRVEGGIQASVPRRLEQPELLARAHAGHRHADQTDRTGATTGAVLRERGAKQLSRDAKDGDVVVGGVGEGALSRSRLEWRNT
jgi:hypothetical protein